jgi:hypothetical protein
MTPLERETKLTVSPEDYRRILEGGRVLERRDQLNVYLHDPGLLEEEMGYFRVRFESGREAVATLKIPSGWHGDTREMVEVERPLRELGPSLHPRPRRWVVVELGVPEGLMEHFQALGISRLRRLGWMRNLRCVVELPAGGIVELDRAVFPGGQVLHEVEIESARDETHRLMVDRVRTMAPSAEISRVGKFDRFLEALGLPGPAGSGS